MKGLSDTRHFSIAAPRIVLNVRVTTLHGPKVTLKIQTDQKSPTGLQLTVTATTPKNFIEQRTRLVLTKMDQHPLNIRTLSISISDICRKDDVALMSQCFSEVQRANSRFTLQQALADGLRKSVKEGATACLSYVLDQGAKLGELDPSYLLAGNYTNTSIRKVLDILVARGYDINSQSLCIPVLWYIIGLHDSELVEWCLDHGAEMNPPDSTPENSRSPRKPILEKAAMVGDIATFELLRSRGAPLDRNFGVFPSAVMVANDLTHDTFEYSACFEKCMNMLKHLLEVAECNANALSYGAHYRSGSDCTTPLCWIACHPRGKGTKARRLIWFLLDHGGDVNFNPLSTYPKDPKMPMQSACESATEHPVSRQPNQFFLDTVRDWETQHQTDTLKEN